MMFDFFFFSKRLKENRESTEYLNHEHSRATLPKLVKNSYVLCLNRTVSFFKYIYLQQLQSQLWRDKRISGN